MTEPRARAAPRTVSALWRADAAFNWLAEQAPDVQFKVLGLDVTFRPEVPRDTVFFVPTRATVERAMSEGRNPDAYFGMITE